MGQPTLYDADNLASDHQLTIDPFINQLAAISTPSLVLATAIERERWQFPELEPPAGSPVLVKTLRVFLWITGSHSRGERKSISL